ncbi:unnamed protein product [Mytilus edulis]|uniref:Uncharacterized protein n=1 Tax=Mytilus edulis TaxID=6550 RepID=A0A8S3Q612_MYTED|nr:unnamed protein product [Mytilus edulis]
MAAATAEVALNVIANGPAVLEKLNSATAAIKSGLHNVKVSRSEADKLERELQGELFDKWDEKCINDNIRKKMEGVLFVNDTWEYKILEYKFNTGKDSGAKYGLIAFGKSPDQKYYDCMYVLYNMDFRVAKKTEFVEKKHRFLWGLFSWTTTDKKYREKIWIKKTLRPFKISSA